MDQPASELSPEEAIAWAKQFGQYENARDDIPESVKAGAISLATLGVTILIGLSTTT
ncbi:MAG: hypothetical protein M3Y56_00190 [Armatimonadota bacterium]|nr:hypothetical protein [Armatimonadota bacterium]